MKVSNSERATDQVRIFREVHLLALECPHPPKKWMELKFRIALAVLFCWASEGSIFRRRWSRTSSVEMRCEPSGRCFGVKPRPLCRLLMSEPAGGFAYLVDEWPALEGGKRNGSQTVVCEPFKLVAGGGFEPTTIGLNAINGRHPCNYPCEFCFLPRMRGSSRAGG